MKKELWLFTMQFPFGNGEAFLENELPILAQGFQRIKLFPMLTSGVQRILPANVDVVSLFSSDSLYRPIGLFKALWSWSSLLALWNKGRSSAPSKIVFAKNRREFLSQMRQALRREQLLRSRMAKEYAPERVMLYSYWTSDWATVLGLWKIRRQEVSFVTRMHGFDLFPDRSPDAWQKFQSFHIAQAHRIFIASKAGMDHIKQQWPGNAEKIRLARLGTRDHGIGPWSLGRELRITSCSNLIPLKRVHLIAEALRHINYPVRWTHFGDGPERARVEAVIKTLPANIHVDLMGSRPNPEVIDWYKANPVDVFVHASYTEGGAPVALQEAASFGIPLVAADAGGVCEIVTDTTGILLPNALTAEALGAVLDQFKNSEWYSVDARSNVRASWARTFNAEEVYGRFLGELQAQ